MTSKEPLLPNAALLVQVLRVLEQRQADDPDPERAHIVDLLRPIRNRMLNPSGAEIDNDDGNAVDDVLSDLMRIREMLNSAYAKIDTEHNNAVDEILDYFKRLEATSLGTPGAQARRRRTSSELIAAILARSAELASPRDQVEPGGVASADIDATSIPDDSSSTAAHDQVQDEYGTPHERLPIHEAVLTSWFGDAGGEEPPSTRTTSAGLPKRTPKANLTPVPEDSELPEADETQTPGPPRGVHQVQERMAGLQDGVRRGRYPRMSDSQLDRFRSEDSSHGVRRE